MIYIVKYDILESYIKQLQYEYEFFEPVYIYKISLQIIVEIGRKKRNNRNRF